MNTYPESPGWKGTDTSRAAAERVSNRAPSIRRKVWDKLETSSMTGEELAEVLQENLYSVLPRLSEMQLDGMVRDSGGRGRTKLDCDAVLWERTPGAVYHDKIKSAARVKRTIKDWQIEKLKEAQTHLQLSMCGHAIKAEGLIKHVLESL